MGIRTALAAASLVCLFSVGCGRGRLGPSAGLPVEGLGAEPNAAGGWEEFRRRHGVPKARGGDFALPNEPSLQDYLTYSALHNPALEAAFHRWRAAVERIEQARTLPDPKFTYAYYFQEVETRVGPQRQAFTLAQTFPWFGKLQRRGDAAAEAAKAEWHRFQGEKLKLYAEIRKAYCEYYYLARALAVTQDNLKLLRQLEALVRIRYKTATASHPDLIRLQIEIGKLADHLATLEELRLPVVARLDAALGRSNGGPLPWPKAITHEPVAATRKQLAEWMSRSNPQLLAMDRQASRAKHKIDLARKDYFPDATVGVKYIDTRDRIGPMSPSDSGQDPVIGMITVNLPIWWRKLAAGVREARSRYWAALRGRKQASHDLTARLHMTLYRLQDAQRKIDLYRRTLIPKARESLKVIQTGFVGGTSTFIDLIEAQRVVLEFELVYQRSLADHASRRADLEQIVGRHIPSRREP